VDLIGPDARGQRVAVVPGHHAGDHLIVAFELGLHRAIVRPGRAAQWPELHRHRWSIFRRRPHKLRQIKGSP